MDLILHLAPKAKPSFHIHLWCDIAPRSKFLPILIHVHMAVLVIINIWLWCKLVIKDVLMSMILLFIIAVICWIYVWNCCKALKQVMFPSCSVLYLNYICEYNFFHKNCFCSFIFLFSASALCITSLNCYFLMWYAFAMNGISIKKFCLREKKQLFVCVNCWSIQIHYFKLLLIIFLLRFYFRFYLKKKKY